MSFPIYTSLTVPMVASFPSTSGFQWSADGQATFLTKTALYIMTPDHGLNYDPSAALKAMPPKNNASEVEPIGWYRTLIQFDRKVKYAWPESSQDWGAIVLGAVDIALWAVTFSPSNVSTNAGCILAALTSSLDLTLWMAGRNGLRGEWIKFYDITPFLIDTFADEHNKVQALKAQIMSIKWTPQVDFGLDPCPLVDGSLLLAGNRAGMILFMRYRNSSVELADSLTVGDQWVISLAASPWAMLEPGKCDAYVAYATDHGAVGVVKIRQIIEYKPATSPFGLSFSIRLSIESGLIDVCPPDHHPATALEWVQTPAGLVLAFCKTGVVYLWRSSQMDDGWSGLRELTLTQPKKMSSGMSPLYSVSGMQYIRRRDALLLCLFDGSFHVVHNLSHSPSWEPSNPDDELTTLNVTRIARSIFTRAEPEKVDADLENRISAMASYDGSATLAWVHEACRPGDMNYKHDAKHNSIFLVAQLWDDTDDEALLQDLSNLLQHCRYAAGFSPIYLLRPILFKLRPQKLNALHARVLQILEPTADADHSTNIAIEPWGGALTPELRSEFRSSLGRHLFGWDVMLSLRMRLSLADVAWKTSANDADQHLCGLVAQRLLNVISHRVLRTMMRHISAVVPCLMPSDIPFVLRLVVQSFLPHSPADLTAEGEHLSALLQDSLPSESEVNTGLTEVCPACRLDVPLEDILTATCPNGHTWPRCSITTFILATPLVRTCVGCSRKAFLPLSSRNRITAGNSRDTDTARDTDAEGTSPAPSTARDTGTAGTWLPDAGRGWVVEELLEAVHRCLFCGNSFVSVL